MNGNSNHKSKPRKSATKPKKPYAKFPLTPHNSGKWMKKIKGQIYYFGNWARQENGKLVRVPGDGWEEALKLYEAQAANLHAGRTPQAAPDESVTVKELCNQFLTVMFKRLQVGKKMSQRTFQQYRDTAAMMAAAFGKNRHVSNLRPTDFTNLALELEEKYGVHRRANYIQGIRTIFKWGEDNDIILKAPKYGSEFKKPDPKQSREARTERLFTAEEIRQLLAQASVPLKAMILLGINCAFGNTDVSSLPRSAVDFDNAVIDFPRPKTAVKRRCPLWPETVEALKAAIAARPKPVNDADDNLVFITRWGHRYVRDKESEQATGDDFRTLKVAAINSVALEFKKLLRKLGINGRKGLGFYTLRHTFRTIADATKDFPAVRLIMGHADSSIDAVYRETIDDSRLRAVVDHVHGWLFAKTVE